MTEEEAPKRGLLRATFEIGPAMQAAVPGLYAWSVTVAPAAFGHGARWHSSVAAVGALFALGAGFVLEHPRASAAPKASSDATVDAPTAPEPALRSAVHPAVPWAFALACAASWAGSPDALSTTRLGSIRGIAGAIGWALFALACAAPPVLTTDLVRSARTESGPKARHALARGDAVYVGVAAVIAFGLQLIGWDVVVPERAVLLRLATLGAGIAIVSAASAIALARHGKRRSVRPPVLWPLALALLLLGGVLVHLLDR
ncbi:hypothetical protein BH09MYX1_BH09MYX1_64750 [soil metagenome]